MAGETKKTRSLCKSEKLSCVLCYFNLQGLASVKNMKRLFLISPLVNLKNVNLTLLKKVQESERLLKYDKKHR